MMNLLFSHSVRCRSRLAIKVKCYSPSVFLLARSGRNATLLRLSIPSRSFVDIRLSRARAVRILRSTSGTGQIPRPEFGLSGRVDRSVPRRSSRRSPRTCAARKCYAVPPLSALDILRTPALAASGKPPLAASASAVPCSPRQR